MWLHIEWKASALKPGFGLEQRIFIYYGSVCRCCCSYVLNVIVGFGPVVAASLVGLTAGILLPAYGAYMLQAYGNVGAGVFPNLVILWPVRQLQDLFILAQDVFNGFGGKLAYELFRVL